MSSLNSIFWSLINLDRDVTFLLPAGGQALDTQRTLFLESGRYPTVFVRIMRFYFRVSGANPGPSNKLLTYRTFEPYMIGATGWGEGIYEGLQQTLGRAQAWLNVTGA